MPKAKFGKQRKGGGGRRTKPYYPPGGWKEVKGFKLQITHTAHCDGCEKHCTDEAPVRSCKSCQWNLCWLCEKDRKGNLLHNCIAQRVKEMKERIQKNSKHADSDNKQVQCTAQESESTQTNLNAIHCKAAPKDINVQNTGVELHDPIDEACDDREKRDAARVLCGLRGTLTHNSEESLFVSQDEDEPFRGGNFHESHVAEKASDTGRTADTAIDEHPGQAPLWSKDFNIIERSCTAMSERKGCSSSTQAENGKTFLEELPFDKHDKILLRRTKSFIQTAPTGQSSTKHKFKSTGLGSELDVIGPKRKCDFPTKMRTRLVEKQSTIKESSSSSKSDTIYKRHQSGSSKNGSGDMHLAELYSSSYGTIHEQKPNKTPHQENEKVLSDIQILLEKLKTKSLKRADCKPVSSRCKA